MSNRHNVEKPWWFVAGLVLGVIFLIAGIGANVYVSMLMMNAVRSLGDKGINDPEAVRRSVEGFRMMQWISSGLWVLGAASIAGAFIARRRVEMAREKRIASTPPPVPGSLV